VSLVASTVVMGGSSGVDKGCEPAPSSVLIFCMSEGASPKGDKPEDTPNARVAE
jgi:hypothetical protein